MKVQHSLGQGAKTADVQPSTSIRKSDRRSVTPLKSPTIRVSKPTPDHQKLQSQSAKRNQRRSAASPIQKPKTTSCPSPAGSLKSPDTSCVFDFRAPKGKDQEAETEDKTQSDIEVLHSDESRDSNGSDVIIIPHPPKPRNKGDQLKVEILSLYFDPSSSVACDQSVHQVYVEYRLVGVPMETTETPMSLRKPTDGEEIHYNFTRVIHVDSVEAAPLRHYLYTVLEGSDPNHGRLKFTVVSEPMNEKEECEDVGYAFLDLRELLLTGNDYDRPIVVEWKKSEVTSADEEQEVVGKLKVSVEAAQALTGIYQEYHQTARRHRSEPQSSTEDKKGRGSGKKEEIQVFDFEADEDFY
ncbi:hypothetical protein DNTS_022224 [Danionella cerebrum]|uniref:RPGRIP1 C-terminal domain-containing protein n=1 Tax=Danionella cerebrum TaxID=2873325 RepID=A0A553PMW9_9TELE|nr:hypothetical protein DNTS_022224 [Danionella translucida]